MTLLIVSSSRADQFAISVRAQDPTLDVRVAPELGDPADIRYALAWQPHPGLLQTLPNLRLIISIGAGVDHLLRDRELPPVRIARYVDPDLTQRMVAYVVLNVLYHHRRMCEFREQQSQKIWKYLPEPAADELRVGIMGLGVLGAACAPALGAFGYRLAAFSRTAKSLPGVSCYTGRAGLDAFLAATDILAVLLPLTAETRGILDRRLIRKLARGGGSGRLPGPVLINAGRGGLQRDADILACLNAGELYAASLDVFEAEPLPHSSPLWSHPRVVITPHIAAESTPTAIARYALEQIRRDANGEAIPHLVDRAQGY
jgi:glyoxylate/hydroxypyruvate reductase A